MLPLCRDPTKRLVLTQEHDAHALTAVLLNADDKFVILACDGIWDVLTNEKAVSVVAKAIKDKQDAAKALVRASFLNGSTDNMTAVVVHLAQA